MQNITAGKIEGRSKLGGSGRLIMSLFVHQLVTDQAKLDTAGTVDDIVYTGVTWHKAAAEGAVGSVYDRIDL